MKITVIKAAEGFNSNQRIRIAENSTDPKELSRLAYDNSRLVRLAVLKNRNTPRKVVDMLCKDLADNEDWAIRKAVAQITTNPELIAKLANDEDWGVRQSVVFSTDDPKLLAKFADDESVVVRRTVAYKTNDPKLLAKLANDKNGEVRTEVAYKTDDPELIEKLANDKDWVVRRAIAQVTNDIELIEELANDKDEYVREEASARLQLDNNRSITDWSIPLYSISNYSEIEDEIDQVIDDAAEAYAAKYLGGTATVDSPAGVYDNPNGKIKIKFDTPEGPQLFSIDAEEILGPATSQNKKQKCVQKVMQWLEKNL